MSRSRGWDLEVILRLCAAELTRKARRANWIGCSVSDSWRPYGRKLHGTAELSAQVALGERMDRLLGSSTDYRPVDSGLLQSAEPAGGIWQR